jgi:inosine-uridine nucleoside N-ribohydrolase
LSANQDQIKKTKKKKNIIPRQNIFPWSLLDNYYFKGENLAYYIADVFFSSLGQITIVTLGPLTNIALAMKLNKNFERNVKNLVTMGGTMEGVGGSLQLQVFSLFLQFLF